MKKKLLNKAKLSLLLLIASLSLNTLCANAQTAPDLIFITWEGSMSRKGLTVSAVLNETFTINWGRGGNTSHIGTGEPETYTQPDTYGDNNTYGISISADSSNVLTGLSVLGKDVTSLEIHRAPALMYLDCSHNSLTRLDVRGASALAELSCNHNSLTKLDVTYNPALTYLDCSYNGLIRLNTSYNPALTYFDCYENSLIALDISHNTALTSLDCSYNLLTALNVREASELTELYCFDNSLITLDVSNNLELTHLYCFNNSLTALDVSNNPLLIELCCHRNFLTTLDVSNNPALIYLDCDLNSLPLINLKALSDIASITQDAKYLGLQTLPLQRVEFNKPIVIDSVFHGVNTTFEVTEGGSMAIANTDYTISGGVITFLRGGLFEVSITNPGLISNPDYPAQVVARFDVQTISTGSPFIDFTQSESIQLFPSLITDCFHIKGITRPSVVSVYSMYGELVLQREVHAEESIYVEHLPSGAYLVLVAGKRFKVIKK